MSVILLDPHAGVFLIPSTGPAPSELGGSSATLPPAPPTSLVSPDSGSGQYCEHFGTFPSTHSVKLNMPRDPVSQTICQNAPRVSFLDSSFAPFFSFGSFAINANGPCVAITSPISWPWRNPLALSSSSSSTLPPPTPGWAARLCRFSGYTSADCLDSGCFAQYFCESGCLG